MLHTKAVFLLGALAMVGCGSSTSNPYGPDPDFNAVQSKLSTPTGTLPVGKESVVFSDFQNQAASQGNGFNYGGVGSSGSSTGVKSLALHVLGNGANNTWCPALENGQSSGSCTCPTGGSLVYDFSGVQQLQGQQAHGPIDVTLRLHADHCSADGGVVDGSEFIKVKSTASMVTADNLFMFLDVHLTMSKPPVQATINLDAEYLGGKWWYAVEVNDGTVIVASDTAHWDGATKTGTVYVHAKDTSWTCQLTSGKGTCTSEKGDVRQVQ